MTIATLTLTIATAGGCSGSLVSNPGTGGSPGTGGGPGTGGAAGGINGSICSLDGTQAPTLWARGVDPQGLGFDYDGAATVAQSTTDTLTLALTFPPDAGTSADAGDGTTNVQITGITPMPLFKIGAHVWLTKSKDGLQQSFGPPPPSSFAVRAGQEGPLLFGGAFGGYGPMSFPVQVDQLAVTCSQSDQTCSALSTLSFAGAVVTGDKPAFVEPDHVGTILLGGALYEVRLYAVTETVVPPVSCTDFFAESEVQIDVRSMNLATLIANLPSITLLDVQ
jgi:hypothetical protein